MALDAEAAACLAWSARICSVGLVWQSLELAWLGRELRDGHLLGRESARGLAGTAQEVSFGGGDWSPDRVFLITRALAAAACWLIPFGSAAGAGLLVGLFVGQLYFNRRFAIVLTNADHLNLLCLGALAAAGWPGASFGLRAAALGFIAFHGLFGYVAAGVDKLLAGNWRTGVRLVAVFQDSSYRVPALAKLASRPPIGALLAWGTILLEVFFPLCLMLPPSGLWIFFAAGALFHGLIGVAMGLPMFLWAFGATYPAIYFGHEWLTAWWRVAPN